MLRNMLCMILLVATTPAFSSLLLRTERNPVCGVEQYEERFDGDVCGWIYKEKQSNACGLDYYNSGADLSCPGSDAGGRVVTASALNGIQWDSVPSRIQGGQDLKAAIGFNPDFNTFGPFAPGGGGITRRKELSFWTCDLTQNINPQFSQKTLKCTAKPYAATCSLAKFGSVYKTCRAESHGNESPKKCRSDKFAAELYNSCSFYKTAEEIDAFIDATAQSLVNNASLLPAKQSDLYTTFRQEASFICLVEKYTSMPGYDDVVGDLTKKFFETFGYEYNESSLTCEDASADDRTYKITAGGLDCKNYDINTIRSVVKPSDMVPAVFTRFKANCTTKVTYDYLVGWFEARIGEVNQLMADIVALSDANRKKALEDLKQSISDAK